MHRDRLSELPLSLIHHILSFLPFRDLVKTTLLSKHWVNLWTTVPCISICVYDEEDEDKFKNFVNRALLLWKGTNILKFKIDIFDSLLVHDAHVWILFALKNKVEELEICTSSNLLITQDVYSCSWIRKLLLWGCDVLIRGLPSWNQLKSLTLDYQDGGEDLINRIMLGSPVLEVFELEFMEYYANLNIMSRSLKSLKINNCVAFVKDETSLGTLSICCPNLETFEIHGLFGKCLFTDVSSLTNVTLDFYSCNVHGHRGPLVELLRGTLEQNFSTIQNVEKVELSDLCVQVFAALHRKYLFSPLPNVKFLKFDVCGFCTNLGNVIVLLGIFPNLKCVMIERLIVRKSLVFNTVNYMDLETKIPKTFLLQLKIVEITTHSFDSSVFGFLELLLKHAIVLEKLVIWLQGIELSEQKMFSEKVGSMRRSSPTAEVIFKSKIGRH